MRLMMAITNKCDKSCRHCCFSSSPQDNRELSVKEMQHDIDEGAQLSLEDQHHRFEVRFTGGEPFLRFQELHDTIHYAHQKGARQIGCTSNGFWARSQIDAREKIQSLKKAGLSDLRLSCDHFHDYQESIQSLRYVFKAAAENNLHLGIKIVTYNGSLRAADVLNALGDITRDIIFSIEEISLLPIGRAQSFPPEMFQKSQGLPNGAWCDLLKTFFIDAQGNLYPCCVPGWPKIFYLGNTRKNSLLQMVHQASNNSLFQAMAKDGPLFFIPFLKKISIDFPEGNYINRCHLCQEVLKTIDHHPLARQCLEKAANTWKKKESWLNDILATFESFSPNGQ